MELILTNMSTSSTGSAHEIMTSERSIDKMLQDVWQMLLKADCISNKHLRGLKELLALGGPQWFCSFIIKVDIHAFIYRTTVKHSNYMYKLLVRFNQGALTRLVSG